MMELDKKDLKELNTFFVKLKKVISTDLFLIGGRLILPGPESDEKLSGFLTLEITSKCTSLLELIYGKEFEKDEKLYIKDITIIKSTSIEEDYQNLKFEPVEEIFDLDYIERRFKYFTLCAKHDESWHKLIADTNAARNEELMDHWFTKNHIISISDPNKKYPDIQLGKSMLPGITEKDIEHVFYTMHEFNTDSDNLYECDFIFSCEMFHMTLQLLYA